MSTGELIVTWVSVGLIVTVLVSAAFGFAVYKGWLTGAATKRVIGFIFFAALSHSVLLRAAPDIGSALLGIFLLVAGAAVAALYLDKKWLWGAVCGMVGLVLVLALGGALFSASGIPQWFHERWNQPAEEEALREVQARGGTGAQASVPIQVTEVVLGKAWRFTLTGPTDAATALQTVAAANAVTTIRVHKGHTYRFSASESIHGRVHLARRYTDGQFWDSVLPAAELHLPGPGEAVRAHAFCPRQDGVVTLWIERGSSQPQEVVVLDTGESAALVIDQRGYDNSGVRINWFTVNPARSQ